MAHSLPTGSHECNCYKTKHRPKLVVLTGGPGGGKTAILEMARRYFCQHVTILPEAASIIFGGGFTRADSPGVKRAAQRAIFQVQRELERVALEDHRSAVVLCDRGTLDGLAYWPGSGQSFFKEFGVTLKKELARYSAVIHVEVPSEHSYEQDGLRKETGIEARAIDRRIAHAWRRHPRKMSVGAQAGFLDKLASAIELLRGEVPACCQTRLHATNRSTEV